MFERGYETVIREPRDPSRSWNGGDYRMTTSYTLLEDGNVMVMHYTSSEFDFCPIYGRFMSCENCPDNKEDGCQAEPEVISREEAERWIRENH
jgi:hypothetical protein